jgi:hypothetical protein
LYNYQRQTCNEACIIIYKYHLTNVKGAILRSKSLKKQQMEKYSKDKNTCYLPRIKLKVKVKNWCNSQPDLSEKRCSSLILSPSTQ